MYVIFVKFVKLLDIEERKALCVRHQDNKAKGIHVYNTATRIVTEPDHSVTVTKSHTCIFITHLYSVTCNHYMIMFFNSIQCLIVYSFTITCHHTICFVLQYIASVFKKFKYLNVIQSNLIGQETYLIKICSTRHLIINCLIGQETID